MAYNALCRILEVIFLCGIQLVITLSGDNLNWNIKISVYICSGLVLLSAASYLSWHMLRPKRTFFAAAMISFKWTEALHDGVSTLIMLVVTTLLLIQNIDIPISIAVFFSMSCALLFAVQAFRNFSYVRQTRIKQYLGLYQVSPSISNDTTGTNTDVSNASGDDSKLLDGDDSKLLDGDDSKLLDREVPTINIHKVDDEEKFSLHDESQKKIEQKITLMPNVENTPEPVDRSGLSDYQTPQETPTGHGNDRASVSVVDVGITARLSPIPCEPAAFTTPPEQVPNTPDLVQEHELLVDVESPSINFDIRRISY